MSRLYMRGNLCQISRVMVMLAQTYPSVQKTKARLRFLSFAIYWVNRGFKRRRLRRQRHKPMISLVEWGKTIVLHVRYPFWCNFFWRNFLTNFISRDNAHMVYMARKLSSTSHYTLMVKSVSNFWRSLPNGNVKFSYLRFWRQRELAAGNLKSFLSL